MKLPLARDEHHRTAAATGLTYIARLIATMRNAIEATRPAGLPA